jgi:hypothetical protein
MPSKIEWTEGRLFVPMLVDMAFSANRPDIQKMRIVISEMVMILNRTTTTIKTRKCFRFRESSILNCMPYGMTCLLLSFFSRRKIFSLNPVFYMTAFLAYRVKAVMPAIIFTKIIGALPNPTLIAPLKPICNFFSILLCGYSNFFCSDDNSAFSRLGRITSLIE